MMDGVRKFVDPPVVTPLPYGLLSAVETVPDGDSKWKLGVAYQPDACEPAHSTQISCPLDDIEDFRKTPTSEGIPTRGSNTVTLYTWIDCSPVGSWDEYERRTDDALDAGAHRALENIFWTGEITQPGDAVYYPHLASNAEVFDTEYETEILLQTAAVVPVTGAVSVTQAIGILEGAMGECYPGVPVLHVPRVALAHLSENYLIERRGDKLFTSGGSHVAAGGGYPGTAPDGTDPAYPITWFYATGAINMRVSETKFTSSQEAALRRDINSMVLIAERTYSLGWDCCHFAVQVDLTL